MYELLREVSVTRIDPADTTYQVSSPSDSRQLAASLDAIGLINPPLLIQDGQKYRIVSGFRRIRAIQKLNWPEIPGRLLPSQASPLACAQIAIAENSSLRNLDIVEQARALRLLESCLPDQDELIATALKIGLPLNPSLIEKLGMVNGMDSVLRDGLAIGAIALPAAIKLHHWPYPDAAQQMGRLLIELNMSLNRQREMIGWMEGILARETIEFDNILEFLGIDKILSDHNFDRRQKIDRIRSLLKKRRYPAITEMENRLGALIKQMKLPGGCQFIPPPYFESNVFSIKIDFCTLPQLDKQLDALKSLTQRNEMRALLSVDPHP